MLRATSATEYGIKSKRDLRLSSYLQMGPQIEANGSTLKVMAQEIHGLDTDKKFQTHTSGFPSSTAASMATIAMGKSASSNKSPKVAG